LILYRKSDPSLDRARQTIRKGRYTDSAPVRSGAVRVVNGVVATRRVPRQIYATLARLHASEV
jgi:hypothetical protein